MPVVRDDRAPKAFGPPPVRRRETPARETSTKAPEAPAEPQLDEFYGHILDVIRAVGADLSGRLAPSGMQTRRPCGTTCWSP